MAGVAKIPSKQLGSPGNNVIFNFTCDSSVAVGDWVRISGTTAFSAQADSAANAHVIGVCVAKSSSVICDIRVGGFTEDVFAGLDTTKTYYLSSVTAGAMSITAPTSSGEVHIRLGKPKSATSLSINIGHVLVRA
jgi:hypothetical protein